MSASHPTRYWFSCSKGIGIGVTAWSREAAEKMAHETLAAYLPTGAKIVNVIENIDIQTLDQNHVIPNMGVPVSLGVWFPRLNA